MSAELRGVVLEPAAGAAAAVEKSHSAMQSQGEWEFAYDEKGA
jgi:hypothetical protein